VCGYQAQTLQIGRIPVFYPRTLSESCLAASDQFPVILLTGPRQVGTTTLLQRLAGEDRRYATLDDPTLRALAQTDPALFLQRYEPPVLIDEIQYAPQFLPLIKMAADRQRKRGLFWLTGSRQIGHADGVWRAAGLRRRDRARG
jgi:predicted AAA+ superfamily ATPase